MSHGPGFGNSCIRRSASSDRWLSSPWLLRIYLGLYYIALSKAICHWKTVKGSFKPSPVDWHRSVLRLCDQTLLSCPPYRAHGMFGRAPALWCSLQTVGRSFRLLACEIWYSQSSSLMLTASTQGVPVGQDREESKGVHWEALEQQEARGIQSYTQERMMTCHHLSGIYLLWTHTL